MSVKALYAWQLLAAKTYRAAVVLTTQTQFSGSLKVERCTERLVVAMEGGVTWAPGHGIVGKEVILDCEG